MSDPRPETDGHPGEGDGEGYGTGEVPGRWIIRLSWAGTALLTVAAVLATLWSSLMPVAVVVSLALFAVGVVAFLAAYARAVGRSRYEAIGMGGLFFLAGSAPRTVQVQLLASFAIEVVVALTASSIRIYTAVAFTILAPMFGIGLAGLWGARHGTFGPRAPSPEVG